MLRDRKALMSLNSFRNFWLESCSNNWCSQGSYCVLTLQQLLADLLAVYHWCGWQCWKTVHTLQLGIVIRMCTSSTLQGHAHAQQQLTCAFIRIVIMYVED